MEVLDKSKFRIVGIDESEAESIVRPNLTYWQDAWRRLKQNKVAIISLFILIILFLMCIFGPYIGPDYKFQDINIANQKPSRSHLFGTDPLGRDMFTRLWIGGRVSLTIGFVGTLVEVLIGCIYGGISGYFGGSIDDVMMRIVEILNSIPYMIVVIVLAVVLKPGLFTLILALCITGWTGMARIVRGQVMQLKESEFILAARALGSDSKRIIFKHLIPNTIGVIIVYTTFDIPAFIFAEAFLSFIGLGIQPPKTSWGALCAYGQQTMDFFPHQLLFPALAICITMLAFNLLGDGLRDALDPKLRQ